MLGLVDELEEWKADPLCRLVLLRLAHLLLDIFDLQSVMARKSALGTTAEGYQLFERSSF